MTTETPYAQGIAQDIADAAYFFQRELEQQKRKTVNNTEANTILQTVHTYAEEHLDDTLKEKLYEYLPSARDPYSTLDEEQYKSNVVLYTNNRLKGAGLKYDDYLYRSEEQYDVVFDALITLDKELAVVVYLITDTPHNDEVLGYITPHEDDTLLFTLDDTSAAQKLFDILDEHAIRDLSVVKK